MIKKYFGTDGIRGTVNQGNINGEKFFKLQGVQIFRVHNVNEVKQGILVFKKIISIK